MLSEAKNPIVRTTRIPLAHRRAGCWGKKRRTPKDVTLCCESDKIKLAIILKII